MLQEEILTTYKGKFNAARTEEFDFISNVKENLTIYNTDNNIKFSETTNTSHAKRG